MFLFFHQPFHPIHAVRYEYEPPRIRQELFTLPTEVLLPTRTKNTLTKEQFTANSIMIIDRESGAVLFEKNPDESRYPASLTKMMTALVAIESYDPSRVVTIQEESQAIGNTAHLQTGEQYTISDLLKATLIPSGNDAAFALASAYEGGYFAFVQRMNQRAKELSMNHTTYLNVSGVEQEGHSTTARDIATLARVAMKNEVFQEIVRLKSARIVEQKSGQERTIESTNQLLSRIEGIEGIKTGWTDQAGECLVTQTTRDGHTIITVVLASDDRFGETRTLIEWAFNAHEWKMYQVE
ncbi:MAG: peptidase S11 [Microgenomates group bacterium GW2011_GWF2_45_18]|nr:MAG: peptidase S11 [Microgenomates group bacterium GW2011_GWF1_44_10]KKU02103.1 MAG: peptidase S11 [Microgenomates group bacterium GW2011_GWF2_45_18]